MKVLLLSFLLVSCSMNLKKKSPPLAWNKKFYWMRMEKPGFIYERDCKNKKISKKRKCSEYEYDLIKDWDKYSPGFIVIPFDLVFP